jgi:TctA family transporter
MTTEALTPKLPTELFDEKTFYTLGGATGAVFLSSWAISYFLFQLLDCYPVKIIHLIVFLLSELVAVIIMLQKKDTKAIKYLFTFLNGLLIFVNVNGLNQMFGTATFIRTLS